MTRNFLWTAVAGALWMALPAQAQRTPEPLSAWPYFKEIRISGATAARDFDFLLDREILDQARDDYADLRLYDAAGKEIPYVLRVRRAIETQEPFTAREYNRGVAEGAAQVSFDLGEQPLEHNDVEIQTAGSNFRRLADVEGSPDGVRWLTLASNAILFRFGAGGRTVEQQAVAYPVSRYRYLRIRVSRDPQVDHAAPEVGTVRIRRTMHQSGEMVSYPGGVQLREPDRENGRPASVWRVGLGARVPFEQVVIATNESSFSRPFRLDDVDDPASPTQLASGELVRRDDQPAGPAFSFPEVRARQLKLTVTDDRNPPLSIATVTVKGAARQVIFEAASAGSGPIRVYYGNSKAVSPHYDLAARLPADVEPPPTRLSLEEQRENPIYSPEPKPFSERAPWLVYLVLGAAALVLAAILLSLAHFRPPAVESGS